MSRLKNTKAKGSKFERLVKAYYEDIGYVVIKQGASLFPDLTCIDNRGVIFIECKVSGSLSKEEKERAEKIFNKTGATFMVATKKYRENDFIIEVLHRKGGDLE